MLVWDWEIDGWIVVAGALTAMASSILGCFLLLRRLSLLGDAISHAVLPGIAAAFLFTGERASWSVFLGAAATGLLTVWLSEAIQKYGQVEESASIGIVFTTMFSIGLVLILGSGDHVDLDPSCILYGNLETSILDTVITPVGPVPRVVLTLSTVLLMNATVLLLCFKEWRITTFDPAYAQSQGVPSVVFHYLLAALVAITCIASFEAVGNILVVAVLIVPAAVSFLLCNRLSSMFWVSMLVAIAVALVGHLSAIIIPHSIGLKSINSAAMMAVVSGAFLILAILVGWRSGVITQFIRQRSITNQILQDDILALMFRRSEIADVNHLEIAMPLAHIADELKTPLSKLRAIVGRMVRHDLANVGGEHLTLTETGRRTAQNLIRSHRLWEQYLSVETNLPESKVHPHAESWEHFTSPSMRGELDALTGKSTTDPHGRTIPPEG